MIARSDVVRSLVGTSYLTWATLLVIKFSRSFIGTTRHAYVVSPKRDTMRQVISVDQTLNQIRNVKSYKLDEGRKDSNL